MLGKTHMAVGMTAGLALLQPRSLTELIVGTGAAAIGALICDIDIDSSESHKDADKITVLSVLTVAGIAVVESIWHIGIYDRLMRNSSLLRVVLGAAAFIVICAFGKEQPHRSFMHSGLAFLLLTGCVSIVFPMAAPYFAVGFVSHVLLDLLNRKGVRLLYPLGHGFSLNLCSAKGMVNQAFLAAGTLGSAALFALSLYHIFIP